MFPGCALLNEHQSVQLARRIAVEIDVPLAMQERAGGHAPDEVLVVQQEQVGSVELRWPERTN